MSQPKGKDKLASLGKKKRLDSQLLRSVASEILTDSSLPEELSPEPGDDALEEMEDGELLTVLMDGEVPPPPDEDQPPPPPPALDAVPPVPPLDSTAADGLPSLDQATLTLLGGAAAATVAVAPTASPKPAGAKPAPPSGASAGKAYLFKKKMPLGEILVRHGVITRTDLEYALKYQTEQAQDLKLGQILLKLKVVPDNKFGLLVNALLAQLKSDELDLDEIGQFVDFSLYSRFKLARLEKEMFFPLRVVEERGSRTLEVFMENDADLLRLDELRAIYNVSRVRPVGDFDGTLLKTLLTEIQHTKASEITPGESADKITVLAVQDLEDVDSNAIQRGREDNYISRITDKIIYDGVRMGASDIHVEFGDVPRVRYRLDGLLQEGGWISPEDYPAVVSRLKIMSKLDISERRVPQDGNIRLGIEGVGVIDFRVNTIPVSGNEKVCLRILDGNKLHSLTLDMIGLPEQILMDYIEKIERTQGMVLITGPTGSGKSTTLYSSLLYLLDAHGKEMNICTAEDPIEYKVEGLNQTQLSEKVGLTFPKILKALLRQDPDIILVGEIRDLETAELGVKASQTGHLVLSTLHTNTAVGTISRICNMGVEAYLAADVLLAIMNQRLVRKICSACAEPYEPTEKELALLKPGERDSFNFIKGRGCSKCNHRGYKGRVGFYEYLPISREMRRLINRKATEEELLYQAKEENFVTMREYGVAKAREGVTTLEEVLHHTIDPFA
ncbi:MAG: type II/IV secretion system protein [Myxococcales bacterium]|nr:MAG: type II/IV secretion system protein [Myxococcales bacterium]